MAEMHTSKFNWTTYLHKQRVGSEERGERKKDEWLKL